MTGWQANVTHDRQEVTTVNREKAEEHLRRDITYPITAEGIRELYDNMRHFTAEDREWVRHVPPGIYRTPEEAIQAVRWGRN